MYYMPIEESTFTIFEFFNGHDFMCLLEKKEKKIG